MRLALTKEAAAKLQRLEKREAKLIRRLIRNLEERRAVLNRQIVVIQGGRKQ